MYIFENYLFVSNYTDCTVFIINIDSNIKIGEIKIDDIYKIDQIIDKE